MLGISPFRFMLIEVLLRCFGERQRLRSRQIALGLCRALGRKRIDAVLDLLAQQARPLTGVREAERGEPAEAHHGLFALRLPIAVAQRALVLEHPRLRSALIDLQVETTAVAVAALLLEPRD